MFFFYVSGCSSTPEVAFVLDSSGSIGKENFQTIVDFSKSLAIDLPLDGGARVALETFSDNVEVTMSHTVFCRETEQYIVSFPQVYLTIADGHGVMTVMDAMTIPYFVGGTTNTAEAIRQATNTLFQS